jgi:hypothetical protein
MFSMLSRCKLSGLLPLGIPKAFVYAIPVDNDKALHHWIVDACQTIRNYPGTFKRMRRSNMRRADA